MRLKLIALAAGVLLLGACANLKDPTTAIAAVDSAYAGAVAGEIAYLSGVVPGVKVDKAIAAQIEAYRVAAHNVLDPINKQIAAGTPPTSDQALAAQAVLNVLTAYLAANNIPTQ